MMGFFRLKIHWLSLWKPLQLCCLIWKKTIPLEITDQKKPLKELNLKNKALTLSISFSFFWGGGEGDNLRSLGLSLSLPYI